MRADRIKKIARSGIIDLPEPQWRAIEKTCGISNRDTAFRQRLSRHIKLACMPTEPLRIGEVDGPKLSKVREQLRETWEAADNLHRTLSRLTRKARTDPSADYAKHIIVSEWSKLVANENTNLWDYLTVEKIPLQADQEEKSKDTYGQILSLSHPLLSAESFIDSVAAQITTACKSASQSLSQNKGGRPKNRALEKLIVALAVAYQQETGKLPFSGTNATGSFFKFCSACLDAFSPAFAKGDRLTLSKRIQRVLEAVWKTRFQKKRKGGLDQSAHLPQSTKRQSKPS